MSKRYGLLLLGLGLCCVAFGQFTYGVKAGLTQSKTAEGPAINGQAMKFKSGVQVGAFVDVVLLKNLYLRPALQLTGKGYIASVGSAQGPYYWYRNWSVYYLELPLDLLYQASLSKKVSLYAGGGPVLGLGLFGSGHYVLAGTDSAGTFHQEGSPTKAFGFAGFRRLDIGADLTAGVQVQRLSLTASYTHGLINVRHDDRTTDNTKHRSLAFTLGYFVRRP